MLYGHAQCETDADVDPDLVSITEFGPHSSFMPSYTTRCWYFDTAEARDRFLARVKAGDFRKT